MTYAELKKVNSEITTTDVKGKMYAEVPQRITAFRKLYPNGCISTEIISLDGDVCIMKATVMDENGKVLGTGTAYEKEGSTFINKTSYIENCETSAVGRALGMCGIGIDTSIASYEEVSNAIAQQEADKIANAKIPQMKVDIIKKKCVEFGVTEASVLDRYKISSLEEMTEKQFASAAAIFAKMEKK